MVLCRRVNDRVELLLAHPGGPYFARKNEGAWSIPKGLVEDGEDLLAAALRETVEELGIAKPSPPYAPLGDIRLKSGKRVHAWAAKGDMEPSVLRSNHVEIEWPPKSGMKRMFPEIDRVEWVSLERARRLANPALVPLFERALSDEVMNMLFGGEERRS
jgi:predicted NUDIX family NTP pyrophosphohydrolase